MKTRNLLSIFLSIVVLISVLPLGALPVSADEIEKDLLSDEGGIFEIISQGIDRNGYLTVTLVAKNCIGLQSARMEIEYDPNDLTFEYDEMGVDGVQVGLTKSNAFSYEIDYKAAGLLKTEFFFKTLLTDKSTFDDDAKTPGTVDINAEAFEALNFIFSVNNLTVDKFYFTVNVIELRGIEATGGTYTVSNEIAEETQPEDPQPTSGKCGDKLTWTLDNEGILTISGTGDMYDYWLNSPFSFNSNITSILIEYGVTSIGRNAFYALHELTSVDIPNSVTSIGDYAFDECSLTSVNIPESVISIGEGAFYNCYFLASVNIPDSVMRIGQRAFSYCASLTSVNIPNSVSSIDGYTFSDCTSLTWVNIPDSVMSIGDSAFSFCISLATVIISDSVTSIDSFAFFICRNLTDVFYTGSEKDLKNIEIGYGNDCLTNATIHYYYGHEHAWDDGVVTKQPTTTSEGIKTYTCTVCGATKTESIPKLTGSVIDSSTVKEKDGSVYAAPGLTAKDVINAAGSGAKILKADGTELKSTEKVGSGMTLVKPDGTKITIIVKGDNDGDGEITASDARFALRTAVSLEKPNSWQKNASLVDGAKSDITASDARMILRAAVNLEKMNLY